MRPVTASESEYDTTKKLTPDLVEVAERELFETETSRTELLRLFKAKISAENSAILACRLDNNFLLRFLRAKKFQLNESFECLRKYLHYRQTYPKAFTNLSIEKCPKLRQLIAAGIVVPLSDRDRFQRRVILIRGGRFDTRHFSATDILRLASLIIETVSETEQDQIRGLTYLVDGSGFGWRHFTLTTPRLLMRIIKTAEKIVPLRHKEVHIFNVPILLRILFDFLLGFLPTKFRSRFYFYKTVKELIEQNDFIETANLPQQYGGNAHFDDLIESWTLEIRRNEPILLLNDEMLTTVATITSPT